jgi:hypothetical protein
MCSRSQRRHTTQASPPSTKRRAMPPRHVPRSGTATLSSHVVGLNAQRQPVAEILPVAAPQQFRPQSERQAGQQAAQDPHDKSGLLRARPQIVGEWVAGQGAAEVERHDGVTGHSRRVEALLNVDRGAGRLRLDGQVEVVRHRQVPVPATRSRKRRTRATAASCGTRPATATSPSIAGHPGVRAFDHMGTILVYGRHPGPRHPAGVSGWRWSGEWAGVDVEQARLPAIMWCPSP